MSPHFHEFGVSRRDIRRERRFLLDKRFVVGPVLGGDGSTPATGRQGKTGESSVSQVHGKYYESASRGQIAFACDQAAGVAVPATVSTVSILSLYNTINSGRRLEILKVWIGYFSGTMGAGSFYHCVTPQVSGTAQTQPTGGVLLTAYWSNINNLGLSSTPIGVARTASTVVTPIVFAPIASSFAELATTANGYQVIAEDLDGLIVLDPGGSYQIQSAMGAAGTTPKVSVGVAWLEVPFVASQG